MLHSTVRLGGDGRTGAAHYVGWCEEENLLRRLRQHQTGTADCAITRAFVKAGGELHLVAVWPNRTRDDERRMKRGGNFARACWMCNGPTAKGEH